MTDFTIHTLETAPEASREVLQSAADRYGFVPNLLREMAASPAAVRAYWAIGDAFAKHSSLTPAEQQLVLLAVSYVNGCSYCLAAHTWAAEAAGLAAEHIEALREGRPLADRRLEALRRFVAELVEADGHPSPEVAAGFFAAGFDQAAALEVVVGIAYKTLSNYTNHLAHTPLDPPLARWEWQRKPAEAAVPESALALEEA